MPDPLLTNLDPRITSPTTTPSLDPEKLPLSKYQITHATPKDDPSPDNQVQTPKYDWTASLPPSDLSPYIESLRVLDWASTPLGPMRTWSHELRLMCNLLMANPNPTIMFWGPELTTIYNEAYAPFTTGNHPDAIGVRIQDAFKQAWPNFEPIHRRCIRTGRGELVENTLAFVDKGFGPHDEAVYSFTYVPIVGEEDIIVGVTATFFETTKEKIGERRMNTLLKTGEVTSSCPDLKTFWNNVSRGLGYNKHDITFALLYSSSDQTKISESHPPPSTDFTSWKFGLEAALGVSAGLPIAPTRTDIEISQGQEGFIPYFQAAAESTEPLFLHTKDGSLSRHLLAGIETPVFQDPCESVVISAVRPTLSEEDAREGVLGFVVMGLNSRQPYDNDYKLFVRLLTRQIGTSMAAAILREEEKRRGRTLVEQAAIDERRVEKELAARTTELEKSELQLRRVADAVLVGIFVIDYNPGYSDGSYSYRNEKWFEMTGDTRSNLTASKSPIWASLHPDDVGAVRDAWNTIHYDNVNTISKFEFRVQKPSEYDEGQTGYTWLLLTCTSFWNKDGCLKTVIGSCTDISSQKWAEDIQRKRVEDALESKRQQESFIDVTSHEMRNPLGAIMISADDIEKTLRVLIPEIPDSTGKIATLLEDIDEAARTILHCAQHQKRIVDDVLTISKLDSGLFNITPTDVQIVVAVKNTLKMFEGEFRAADIEEELSVAESYRALNVDWVLLDPSRVMQILINLITNAIKFTRDEATRGITVHIGASLERPLKSPSGIAYLPPRKPREDLTLRPEWGNGESLYLLFGVADSGCGLTDDEKKILFLRFSQTPRTHVNYGGSGLGLFICRELTELQGGGIGVASEHGVGSMFTFYIKARRSTAAPTDRNLQQYLNMRPQTHLFPGIPRNPSPSRPERAETQSSQESQGFDILLVEDNKINQQVLSKQLRKLGHRVTIANHGLEAINSLSKSKLWKDQVNGVELSVVLMDIEMPVMDGLTCVKKIRCLQEEGELVKHVPIIAITANARAEHVEKALGAGMDDFVSKPFGVPDLVARMERLLSLQNTAS
ncbi:hypothetical protein AOQ84DRAFT_329513 [Glonium stellatum]|uniref:Uncharacterized protein n=1 Tax=Glonium stellatum TaxID=574774 RepID=A0A8E2FDV5_9PEZI|nr:hypothetical protein AOQ84DRAFT_329513 [Glonium stellatum]